MHRAGAEGLLYQTGQTAPALLPQERVETSAVNPEVYLTKDEIEAIDDMLFTLYRLSMFSGNDEVRALGVGEDRAVLSMEDVTLSVRRAAQDIKLLSGGRQMNEAGERLDQLVLVLGEALYSKQTAPDCAVPKFAPTAEVLTNYLGNKWTSYYKEQFDRFLSMQKCFISNKTPRGEEIAMPNGVIIGVGTRKDDPPKNIATLNSDANIKDWRERQEAHLRSHNDGVGWRIRHIAHTQAVVATLQGARAIGNVESLNDPIDLINKLMPLLRLYKDH